MIRLGGIFMAVDINIKGVALSFETSEKLFSPNQIDQGTLAMLSTVEFHSEDQVLDVGCGYGVVGILAARLIGSDRVRMVDIDLEAVKFARMNAERNEVEVPIFVSDGLKEVYEDNFTLILSNPPYHEDFSIPKGFIEDGFTKLSLGGKMVMVVKRLDWYKNKLKSIFGGVKVEEINGYYVLSVEKRAMRSPKKGKKIVSNKHKKRQQITSNFKKRRK